MARMARTSSISQATLIVALTVLCLSGTGLAKGGNKPPPPRRVLAPPPPAAATVSAGAATAGAATPSPTPAPAATTVVAATPSPTPAPATAAAGGTPVVGSGTSSGKWDPLVPPGGSCALPVNGIPVTVRGFPSSPWSQKPFTKTHKPLTRKSKSTSLCKGGNCMDAYNITIKEFYGDMGFEGKCEGPTTPLLGYDGISPGPLIVGQQGTLDLIRFTNEVNPKSIDYPPAGHGEDHDICKNRPKRVPLAPVGTGRGFSVHHHGMASLSTFDGWADQFFCYGETKDYVIPNNRHATGYYHDHAIGITSENAYAGLAAMRITKPCNNDDPFNVEGLEEHHLIMGDFVLGSDCKKRYDREGAHEDFLFGDINTVNGVPWPKLALAAKHHRFRILNSASSRVFILQVRDESGVDIAPKSCKIVGADGGNVASPIPLPKNGLLTDVAYRWDVVCDFSAYAGQSLYLYNLPDDARTASDPPFFCYSHLLMRFDVGPKPDSPGPIPALDKVVPIEQNAALSPALLNSLEKRALTGSYDRSLKFGHSGGFWSVNGRGWDEEDTLNKGKHIEFNNVGQNTVELWSLESGGGWVHPIHIHLIDFFCVAIIQDGGGLKACPPELRQVPKDVIHIGANVRQLIVAARYGPHIGEYMMHCHNTVHEDADMLRAFLVVNATKGLTLSKTPSFNIEAYSGTPQQLTDAKGSDFNTTYTQANIDKYPLGAPYVEKMLARRYYNIFYPPTGSYMAQPENNMWITTCGINRPETPDEVIPTFDPEAKNT